MADSQNVEMSSSNAKSKKKRARNRKHALTPKTYDADLPIVNSTESLSTESQQESFDRELAWCVQQLELGIGNAKTTSNARQVEEAINVLKVLKNPKAPMPKKRLVMRSTFGDYRKKMEEEKKTFGVDSRRVKFVHLTSQSKPMPSSVFYRRSAGSNASFVDPTLRDHLTESSSTERHSFTFQFPMSLDMVPDCAAVSSNTDLTTTTTTSTTVTESLKQNSVNNSYHFEPSAGHFKFNFVVNDVTD